MIHDFVVTTETGTDYQRFHFDTETEAMTVAESYINTWDYVTVQRRELNMADLTDTYVTIFES